MTSSNPGTTRPRQEPSSGTLKKAFINQIKDRNFLAPTGFQFSVTRSPKVSYFGNMINIPGITLGVAQQPSYLKNIDVPGEKLTYGDLEIRFLVDENMENYMAVHNWLTGLGFPETPQQFIDKTTDSDGIRDLEEQYCDGGLHILNSNLRDVAVVKFQNLFPVSLTSLSFDATETDINYFTASAAFRYTVYNITDTSGNLL